MIGGYPTNQQIYGTGQPMVTSDYGYNQQQSQQKSQAPQIIDGGFITVQSVEEAKSYPVAIGTCVTFKVEGAPYICTKFMGFSMLDQPTFKKFKLIEENEEGESGQEAAFTYATKEEHEALADQIRKLSEEIGKLKAKKRPPKVREDDEYDE